MKTSRFLTFVYSYYDPGSPAEQYVGSFDTIKEARARIEEKGQYIGSGEIFDTETGEWSEWTTGPGDVWMLGDEAAAKWQEENRRLRESK